MESIDVYMGSVFTLAFFNDALGDKTPRVWVFTDKSVYKGWLAELQCQEHIRVVQSGISVVKGEEPENAEWGQILDTRNDN